MFLTNNRSEGLGFDKLSDNFITTKDKSALVKVIT